MMVSEQIRICNKKDLKLLSDCIVVVIGFNRTLYEVSENDGQATVDVVLVKGILRRPVVVTVSTRDGTALSEFYTFMNKAV